MAYYKPKTAIHWRSVPGGYRARCMLCPRALGAVPNDVELQVLVNAHLRDNHPMHGTYNMPSGMRPWLSDDEVRSALAERAEWEIDDGVL